MGIGQAVIALGSDVDCIRRRRKAGVAYHDPIIEGAPGHGEGTIGHARRSPRRLGREKGDGAADLQGTLMLWLGHR